MNDEQGAPPVLQDCILIPVLLSFRTHLEIHWTHLKGMASLSVLWEGNGGQRSKRKKKETLREGFLKKKKSFLLFELQTH